MHQKHRRNQDSKPGISVIPSNEIVDIQPVTPPQTAENATLNANETKGSKNGNNANTQAATTVQYRPQPRYPTRQLKASQRLGFNT